MAVCDVSPRDVLAPKVVVLVGALQQPVERGRRSLQKPHGYKLGSLLVEEPVHEAQGRAGVELGAVASQREPLRNDRRVQSTDRLRAAAQSILRSVVELVCAPNIGQRLETGLLGRG